MSAYLDWAGLQLYHQNLLETLNDIQGAVNNGTLTITKNNTAIGTFQANQATNGTINIEVPTTISDLDATAITEIRNIIKYGIPNITGKTSDQLNNLYVYGQEDVSGLSEQEKETLAAAKKVILGLAAVATTGSYNDLTNKPTNVSSFTNDAGYLTSHQDISGKANTSDLATVATTGSYEDLTHTPTIPTVPTNVSAFTNDADYLVSSDLSVNYDSATTKVQLKKGNTVISEFSASAFIKDGMVSDVRVGNGTGANASVSCLIIDFNTDSGITDIEIPLSTFFPSTYVSGIKIGDSQNVLSPVNGVVTIPEGAANVQADWEESDSTDDAYIQNKPTAITNAQILNLFQ